MYPLANKSIDPARVTSAGANSLQRTLGAAVDEQEQLVQRLHSAVSELEDRVAAILDPQPVDGGSPTSAAQPPQQPRDRVDMHNRGLDYAIMRINQLRNRIHL